VLSLVESLHNVIRPYILCIVVHFQRVFNGFSTSNKITSKGCQSATDVKMKFFFWGHSPRPLLGVEGDTTSPHLPPRRLGSALIGPSHLHAFLNEASIRSLNAWPTQTKHATSQVTQKMPLLQWHHKTTTTHSSEKPCFLSWLSKYNNC